MPPKFDSVAASRSLALATASMADTSAGRRATATSNAANAANASTYTHGSATALYGADRPSLLMAPEGVAAATAAVLGAATTQEAAQGEEEFEYGSPTRKQKRTPGRSFTSEVEGQGGATPTDNDDEADLTAVAAATAAAAAAEEEEVEAARREAVRCAKEDAALRTACRKFASFLSSLGRSPGEVDREQFGQLLRTLRHQVGSKLIRRLTFTTSMCIGLGPVVER